MTDTTHDSTLGEIERVTDRLAYINCSKVPGVTIYEEDELLARLAQLNTKFGKEIKSLLRATRQKPRFMRGAMGDTLMIAGTVTLVIGIFVAAVVGMIVILQIAAAGLSSYPGP